MPVLTVCNHKGGTGKTTSSIHLAAAFGHAGGRVLVIDFDPQGFLTRMLGADEPPPEHSALGLLASDADLGAFPVQTVSGFDLVGSSMALTKALRTLTKPTDVLWLRETLATDHGYDIVLIDTAAALSALTMNALAASDLVVIPVTPEYQPVVGAEQTWQTCGLVQDKLNPRLATPRFMLTQVDGRLNRHEKYAAYLRGKYGEAVLETPIRTSSSLAAASRDGRTVFDAGVATRGAVDYRNAAKEIARYLYASATRAAPPEAAPPEAAPPAQDETPGGADPSAGGAGRAVAVPAPGAASSHADSFGRASSGGGLRAAPLVPPTAPPPAGGGAPGGGGASPRAAAWSDTGA